MDSAHCPPYEQILDQSTIALTQEDEKNIYLHVLSDSVALILSQCLVEPK